MRNLIIIILCFLLAGCIKTNTIIELQSILAKDDYMSNHIYPSNAVIDENHIYLFDTKDNIYVFDDENLLEKEHLLRAGLTDLCFSKNGAHYLSAKNTVEEFFSDVRNELPINSSTYFLDCEELIILYTQGQSWEDSRVFIFDENLSMLNGFSVSGNPKATLNNKIVAIKHTEKDTTNILFYDIDGNRDWSYEVIGVLLSDIEFHNGYLFGVSVDGGVFIYEVDYHSEIKEISNVKLDFTNLIIYHDKQLFVSNYSNVYIIDIQDVHNLRVIAEITEVAQVRNIIIHKEKLYVVDATSGIFIYDIGMIEE